MIRAVAIISLVSLLLLVFYLPAAHPPDQFVRLLYRDLRESQRFWGQRSSTSILARALDMQEASGQIVSLPAGHQPVSSAPLDAAVAKEVSGVQGRLFQNSYFRSMEALYSLACFRLSMMAQWLPWLLFFSLPIAVDCHLHRIIRAKQFGQFDPEVFAVWACSAIVTACAAVLGLVAPLSFHPLVMPCAPLLVVLLAGLAWRSYHRR